MLSAACNPHLSTSALRSGRLLLHCSIILVALTARVYGAESAAGQLLSSTATCLDRLF